MAAIANVVLADGQSTPVNRTFNPADCTSALASWSDRTGGVNIGFPQLTLSLTKQPSGSKLVGKVVLPVLETISGDAGGYNPIPKVGYELLGKFEIVLPDRSTLQDRKNIQAFTKNFLANAVVSTAVEGYERPF